jgi:uncharacterized protein (DUF2062 family)
MLLMPLRFTFLKAFFTKNIRQPLTDLLKQGLTPKKLACAMALGLTIGMLPCPWGSTVLCALVAFLLRINHVAIQVANYLAWPLQITFFAPFFWAGQKLFPFGASFSLENLTFSSFQQPLDSLGVLLIADIKAVAVWLLLSPLIYLFIYSIAIPIFFHLKKKHPATA